MEMKIRRSLRPTFGDVEVEEITIENRLNNSSNDGNPIDETFGVVTIDPVENVEKSIDSQGK